jgi:phosphate transport system permease protein
MTQLNLKEPASLAPSGSLRRRYFYQKIAKAVMGSGAVVSVVVTFLIIFSLIPTTITFLQEVGTKVFGTSWGPLFVPATFGLLPLIIGTMWVVIIAVIVAVPLGLAAAIYMSEYAAPSTRRIVKPIVEVLAGIPTVVLGLFGLYFVNPELVQKYWPIGEPTAYTALGAGLVTGILILPIVATISDDAMRSVPGGLREAAFALGSTRSEVATKVVVGASLSGIMAAVILAVSRAFGETTVALMVAGSYAQLTLNPGDAMQTMASFIGFAGIGDQSVDSTGYRTIFFVGSMLFAITWILNIIALKVIKRFREVYE